MVYKLYMGTHLKGLNAEGFASLLETIWQPRFTKVFRLTTVGMSCNNNNLSIPVYLKADSYFHMCFFGHFKVDISGYATPVKPITVQLMPRFD